MKQTGIVFALSLLTANLFAQFKDSSSVSKWNTEKYLWNWTDNEMGVSGKFFLNFKDIENWKYPANTDQAEVSVSRDGKYLAYGIGGYQGQSVDSIIIQAIDGSWRKSICNAQAGFFSLDNKFYVLRSIAGLCFVQLGGSSTDCIKGVGEFKRAMDLENDWIAWRGKSGNVVLRNLLKGFSKSFPDVESFCFDMNAKWLLLSDTSKELLLYGLSSGNEKRFAKVENYKFSNNSTTILLNSSRGLSKIALRDGSEKLLWSPSSAKEHLADYCFDKSGEQIVLIISNESYGNSIWYWKDGMNVAIKKLENKSTELVNRSVITSTARFTPNGKFIIFKWTYPVTNLLKDPNVVKLSVWNYKDQILQSAQPFININVNYTAVLNVESNKVTQLENETRLLYSNFNMDSVPGEFAIVTNNFNTTDRFWKRKDSTWIISLQDGKTRYLPTSYTNSGNNKFIFSPDGNYLIYFDKNRGGRLYSYNVIKKKLVEISAGAPAGQFAYKNGTLHDEIHILKMQFIAWISKENAVLVSDCFDIWKLYFDGSKKPINLTNSYGVLHDMTFDLSGRTSDNIMTNLEPGQTLLLNVFNNKTKGTGFFRKNLRLHGDPEKLYLGECYMEDNNLILTTRPNSGMPPLRIADKNLWVVKKQTNTDPPNYYLTSDFKQYKQITYYNDNLRFVWPKAELHNFNLTNGKNGKGILFKPGNFNPSKKYPVLIIFYDQYTNDFQKFTFPSLNDIPIVPGKSPHLFLQNGYLVFAIDTDIYLEALKYGPSSLEVIDGAARYLKHLPFVDDKSIGAISHSWGAKFASYAFTHSKELSAILISEGFGYGNLISRALYIDDEIGAGQSQLWIAEENMHFGNLWKNKSTWLDQTTVLNVDKARMPIMLYCGKRSAKEYQNQTIQLFTALRRLEKKAWWVQYDDGGHVVNGESAKDMTIRSLQFFNHFLKRGPAPKWMTEGLPNDLIGVEARLELDPSGNCGVQGTNSCSICDAWNEQYKRTPQMFQLPISEWHLSTESKSKKDINSKNQNTKTVKK